MAVTPESLGTRFVVPVLLLHGTEDHYALPAPAREYAEAIEAPVREFVALDGLGHFGPVLHPERVLAELRFPRAGLKRSSAVRPAALKRRSA